VGICVRTMVNEWVNNPVPGHAGGGGPAFGKASEGTPILASSPIHQALTSRWDNGRMLCRWGGFAYGTTHACIMKHEESIRWFPK